MNVSRILQSKVSSKVSQILPSKVVSISTILYERSGFKPIKKTPHPDLVDFLDTPREPILLILIFRTVFQDPRGCPSQQNGNPRRPTTHFTKFFVCATFLAVDTEATDRW